MLLSTCSRVGDQFKWFTKIKRMNNQINRAPHSKWNILSVLYIGVCGAKKVFYGRRSKFAKHGDSGRIGKMDQSVTTEPSIGRRKRSIDNVQLNKGAARRLKAS